MTVFTKKRMVVGGIVVGTIIGGFLAYTKIYKPMIREKYRKRLADKGITTLGTYDMNGKRVYTGAGISVGQAKDDKEMLLNSGLKYPLIAIGSDGELADVFTRKDIEKMLTIDVSSWG